MKTIKSSIKCVENLGIPGQIIRVIKAQFIVRFAKHEMPKIRSCTASSKIE